jgi:hypothetical protein
MMVNNENIGNSIFPISWPNESASNSIALRMKGVVCTANIFDEEEY